MSYIIEDEIDWSDGSLDQDPAVEDKKLQQEAAAHDEPVDLPRPAYPPNEPFAFPRATQRSPQTRNSSCDHNTRRVGARAFPSKRGVRLIHRQPTKDELSKFALYQANQKTYEAMFLRTFVNHALHPSRLDLKNCLSSNPDAISRIEDYLKAVSSNVSQITNKMIWNAHFKSTNLLAKNEQDQLPFINVDSFKDGLFQDFGPESSSPVVQKMNQSWHRVYNASSMVKHSLVNYPIATHRSPLEDVKEAATQNLLDGKGLPIGRVIKPPTRKSVGIGNARHNPKASLQYRRLYSRSPTDVPADTALSNTVPSVLEQLVAQSNVNTDVPLGGQGITHLEALVAQYDPDVVMQDAEPEPAPKEEHWRTKLMNQHKRLLAGKRLRSSHQPSEEQLPEDIKSIVARAIERGFLQPPVAEAQRKLNILAAKEKVNLASTVTKEGDSVVTGPLTQSKPATASVIPSRKKKQPGEPPRKKSKTTAATTQGRTDCTLSLHPSGSKTLEPHQALPPNAYFTRTDDGEKPVWRCGIKHAMGYYYNAGDRRNCVGCFTSSTDNPKAKQMDFYMPSRSSSFQNAPGIEWKPSKDHGKVRRSSHLSHNSIAKIAYWTAIKAGFTTDEAGQKGREAVLEHLRPKPKPEPIREPTPEPEPEPVDLGPHPSGSKTMEHGQSIPNCYYFEKKERHEELAWRCDSGHALGRYYMSGDKSTCPGCGSSITGLAKKTRMDFYMPSGKFVRQDAPGLVVYHPRKPYKTSKQKRQDYKQDKTKVYYSHNQICTKYYWDTVVEDGLDHDTALERAVEKTKAVLDAKDEAGLAKRELTEEGASDEPEPDTQSTPASGGQTPQPQGGLRRNSDRGLLISLNPRKRGRGEPDSDSEDDREGELVECAPEEEPAVDVADSSSDDESSSSDSE